MVERTPRVSILPTRNLWPPALRNAYPDHDAPLCLAAHDVTIGFAADVNDGGAAENERTRERLDDIEWSAVDEMIGDSVAKTLRSGTVAVLVSWVFWGEMAQRMTSRYSAVEFPSWIYGAALHSPEASTER